jgi:hypothetical protein
MADISTTEMSDGRRQNEQQFEREPYHLPTIVATVIPGFISAESSLDRSSNTALGREQE